MYDDDSYTRHHKVCRFNTEIEEKLHAEFKEMCLVEGIPLKRAVDTMLREYLENYKLNILPTSQELSRKKKKLQSDLLMDKELNRIVEAYLNIKSLARGK